MMAADRMQGRKDKGLGQRFPASLVLFSLMRKGEIEVLSPFLLGPYLDNDHPFLLGYRLFLESKEHECHLYH